MDSDFFIKNIQISSLIWIIRHSEQDNPCILFRSQRQTEEQLLEGLGDNNQEELDATVVKGHFGYRGHEMFHDDMVIDYVCYHK